LVPSALLSEGLSALPSALTWADRSARRKDRASQVGRCVTGDVPPGQVDLEVAKFVRCGRRRVALRAWLRHAVLIDAAHDAHPCARAAGHAAIAPFPVLPAVGAYRPLRYGEVQLLDDDARTDAPA
jgi:hypothetical protein